MFLHNGKKRLGAVSSEQTTLVREVILRRSQMEGSDQVLVCKASYVNAPRANYGEDAFRTLPKFNVYPVYSVNERLARKFSNKYRKD